MVLNALTLPSDVKDSHTSPILDFATDTIPETRPVEQPAVQTPAIKKEPAQQPAPIISQPENSKAEKIKSQELEDLFNSAAQSIL